MGCEMLRGIEEIQINNGPLRLTSFSMQNMSQVTFKGIFIVSLLYALSILHSLSQQAFWMLPSFSWVTLKSNIKRYQQEP